MASTENAMSFLVRNLTAGAFILPEDVDVIGWAEVCEQPNSRHQSFDIFVVSIEIRNIFFSTLFCSNDFT